MDRARFTPNDVHFSLAPKNTRELVVRLQSVVSTDSDGKEIRLLPEGIWTLVDSTVPQIWLPMDACKAFQDAFGLDYNPISNLYTVDDKLHEDLKKRNASVVFVLSNDATEGPRVSITLPYASFDLVVEDTYPSVSNRTRYFPLRQARGKEQYTLGRTFLQES